MPTLHGKKFGQTARERNPQIWREKIKNTLCAKTTNTLNRTRQDSVARRPSEREEAKTKMIAITVTRSVGPDIKVYLPDDVSDIVFMVFKFCCFMTKCCLVDDDVPLAVRREPPEG